MLQKRCKKCLEAENFPLTDLLFYILKILDPFRYTVAVAMVDSITTIQNIY